MVEVNPNVIENGADGMKQRMGTMGILIRGGDPRGGEIEVLLIQRRFKDQEILENGPPGITYDFIFAPTL